MRGNKQKQRSLRRRREVDNQTVAEMTASGIARDFSWLCKMIKEQPELAKSVHGDIEEIKQELEGLNQ